MRRERLEACLENRRVPETLVSRYLAPLYPAVAAGNLAPTFGSLTLAAVEQVLCDYSDAAAGR